MSDEAIRFACEFLTRDVLVEGINSAPPGASDFYHMYKALEQASIDPDTNDFDTLVVVAVDLLRKNEQLPGWLAKFAADVLSGERKRPTKRGADKYTNWERDYKLWRCVDEVSRRFSLPKYDNTDLYENETSAGMVSEASGFSIEVVVTAYKKMNRLGVK